jgi:hypothetical protein
MDMITREAILLWRNENAFLNNLADFEYRVRISAA